MPDMRIAGVWHERLLWLCCGLLVQITAIQYGQGLYQSLLRWQWQEIICLFSFL